MVGWHRAISAQGTVVPRRVSTREANGRTRSNRCKKHRWGLHGSGEQQRRRPATLALIYSRGASESHALVG